MTLAFLLTLTVCDPQTQKDDKFMNILSWKLGNNHRKKGIGSNLTQRRNKAAKFGKPLPNKKRTKQQFLLVITVQVQKQPMQ